MPTVTIHRRKHSIYGASRPDYLCARWIDYSFEPLEPVTTTTRDGLRLVQDRLPPVEVVAPPLARLIDRELSGRRVVRLRTDYDTWGIDAEIAYRLAIHQDRGFSMAAKVAKKPEAPRPLFGDDGAPTATAYPKPGLVGMRPDGPSAPAARPIAGPDRPSGAVEEGLAQAERIRLSAIARQVVDEHHRALVDRINALEAAMRRAIEQLDADRWTTARAILECGLDWTPGQKEAVA